MLATFHCATAALTQVEDELHHLCHYGRPLLLVFGAPGGGKSHLFQRLKTALQATLPVAAVSATPLLTAEQLQTDVLRQLGLHQLVGVEPLLADAIVRAPVGRRVLLVDDAHDLHLSVLRDLLLCARAERDRDDPRLAIVLFGDDMLQAALAELDDLALSPDDVHRFQMPAFTPDDINRLATVWAAANGEADPDRRALAELAARSQGWPGPVLSSLDQSRLQARSGARLTPEIRPAADEGLRADPRPAPKHEEQPASAEGDARVRTGWWKTPAMVAGVFVLALLLLYQRDINAWLAGDKPAPAAAAKTAAADDAQPATQAKTAAPAEPAGPTEDTLEARNDPRQDLSLRLPESEPPAADLHAPVAASETPDASNKPAAVEAPAKTAEKAVASKPQPAATPPSQRPSSPAPTSGLSADEQALLAAPDSQFVLQLIGLKDEKTLNAFLAQHRLEQPRVYRAERNGSTLHMVVLGPFADRAAAEKAKDSLPEALRKAGAFPKALTAVKKDLRNR